VKRPRSQRLERQGGMHRLEVGKLYDPTRRSWPEQADYSFRAGGHELRIFMTRLSPKEIASVRTGRVEFGLLVELPEIFIITRFHGPDDRLVLSIDCSYSWHRVSDAERTAPPAWEETSPQTKAVCTVILVEASYGLTRALRAVSYSPEFTRSFHRAIADQAALPYDQVEHERAVEAITRRFTTEQLWERCTIHCEGGA
jgi:hypothetical protein